MCFPTKPYKKCGKSLQNPQYVVKRNTEINVVRLYVDVFNIILSNFFIAFLR